MRGLQHSQHRLRVAADWCRRGVQLVAVLLEDLLHAFIDHVWDTHDTDSRTRASLFVSTANTACVRLLIRAVDGGKPLASQKDLTLRKHPYSWRNMLIL